MISNVAGRGCYGNDERKLGYVPNYVSSSSSIPEADSSTTSIRGSSGQSSKSDYFNFKESN